MNRKPLAAHGTYARANGRPSAGIPPCQCEPCHRKRTAYRRRRDVLAATGRQLTVPPGRAAAHIDMLLAGGASWATLKAAGCDNQTVKRLVTRQGGPIHRTTETRILAIRLEDVISPYRRIAAVGTVRRIQALLVIGYRIKDISAACSSSLSQLHRILSGELLDVSAAEAARIATTYGQLARTPGTSARSRMRAQRAGWAGPMQWGPEIDDPTAAPEPDPEQSLSKRELAAERVTEIQHLAMFGVTASDIAARLGLSLKYVQEQISGRRGPGWRAAA